VNVRLVLVIASVTFIAAALGCSDNTKPEPQTAVISEIQFYGATYNFQTVECAVSSITGGTPVYYLTIRFVDEEDRAIEFSIQDQQNNPGGLVAVGSHAATGQHWDGIRSDFHPFGFFFNHMNAGQLAVVWEEITLSNHMFSGAGYIELRERIDFACADSIYYDGEFCYPGDPMYDYYHEFFCEPGYYYPAQEIRFACENGEFVK
jgi:hypothetical protein